MDLFRLTQEESRLIMYLSDFEYLHPFQRYSPSNFEVIRNCTKFCMFLGPKFFWDGHPNTLDWHYKIQPSSDHHAKFHADRPTHLEDLALKKKSAVKHKPPPLQAIASGRTNYYKVKIKLNYDQIKNETHCK